MSTTERLNFKSAGAVRTNFGPKPERTWKIRDQMPDGSWGPEYPVTLAQYLAQVRVAADKAKAIHAANIASLKREARS